MKTFNAISFLIIVTITAFCQPINIYASGDDGSKQLSFTAHEIHPDEVLLTWKGNFHSDDFSAFAIFESKDGSHFDLREEVDALTSDQSYNLLLKGGEGSDMHYQLAAKTIEGNWVVLKTIFVPREAHGLTGILLKSNHLIYFNSTDPCTIEISNQVGEILMELDIKQGPQTIDISSLRVGKYKLKSQNGTDVSSLEIERI